MERATMTWATGRCSCGQAEYELTGEPLIIHACHCLDCQRISGGPLVINLWIESERFQLQRGSLRTCTVESGSGKGQELRFCPQCGTCLCSQYLRASGNTLFVRAGTLDDPSQAKPDVHIFTRSKAPWLRLPEGVPSFEAYYDFREVWPQSSIERFRANRRAARASAAGQQVPEGLKCYHRTETFEQATVPDALKNEHRLKPGTWGRLVVLRGSVDFWLSGSDSPEQSVQSGTFRWIAPQESHRVEPSADAQFYVEFLRQGTEGE